MPERERVAQSGIESVRGTAADKNNQRPYIVFMISNESAAQSALSIPRSAILLLSLAAFGSAVSLRVTDPLLPYLASEFSVSLGTASYVITLFSVAYGLSQLFF